MQSLIKSHCFSEKWLKNKAGELSGDPILIDKKAKITASKIFCIANLLFSEKNFDFETELYLNNKVELIGLPAPYEKLDRLKPILPEAFYYVWRGTQL